MALWVAAIVFGVYKAYMQSDTEIANLSGYTFYAMDESARFGKIFSKAVVIHFCYALALVISAFFMLLLPLMVLVICFKGYCTGFVAGCIFMCRGIYAGVRISLVALVMPCFVILPVLMAMYVLSLKYQTNRIKCRLNGFDVQKKNDAVSYAAAMLILFVCLCVCSCAEAFFLPLLMKLCV